MNNCLPINKTQTIETNGKNLKRPISNRLISNFLKYPQIKA